MTGLLFAIIFAAGVGLVWFGVMADLRLSRPAPPVRVVALLVSAGLDFSPYVFMAVVAGCGVVFGLLAWLGVDVPAVTIGAAVAGVCAPIAWVRSRRQRRAIERERAWPAVLAQLADALEAGLAWPAAVALVAESGPVALRGEWAAFMARLRGSDLDTALECLRRANERTADSIVLLLRAALVELPTGRSCAHAARACGSLERTS